MTIKEIQQKINDLMTTNTSKEDIEKIATINKDLDDIQKSMDDSSKAYNELKDDYISIIKGRNLNKKDSTDIDGGGDAPTDLESIAKDVIANRKK